MICASVLAVDILTFGDYFTSFGIHYEANFQSDGQNLLYSMIFFLFTLRYDYRLTMVMIVGRHMIALWFLEQSQIRLMGDMLPNNRYWFRVTIFCLFCIYAIYYLQREFTKQVISKYLVQKQ